MENMRVVMTLSLDDLASGPLGRFMAAIERLQQQTAEVGGEFGALGKTISGVAAKAAEASAASAESVSELGDAVAGAAEKARMASTSMVMRWRAAMASMAESSDVAGEAAGTPWFTVADKASRASMAMVSRWQKAMADMAASTAEAGGVIQEQLNAWGLTAAEESARLDAVVAAAMERMNAARAYAADLVGSRPSAAGSTYAASGVARDTAAEIADFGALDGIMRKTAASADDLAAQESALDRLQQAGLLSAEEYAAALAALNAEEEALGLQVEKTTAKIAEQDVAMKGGGRGRGFRFHGYYGTLSQGLNWMMTPTGAVVGGLAAVAGMALYGAYKENQFNEALIATGQDATGAGSSLQSMARRIAGTGVPLRYAQAALLALTRDGNLTGKTLERAGQAAAQMASMMGVSATQAAQQIDALAKDPVKAVAKLNDQFHFLTLTQFKAIDALATTGRTAQAAALAISDFARVMNERMRQASASTTPLMKALDSLDWLINRLLGDLEKLGQTLGPAQQLKSVQDQLDSEATKGYVKFNALRGPSFGWQVTAAGDSYDAELVSRWHSLKQQVATQRASSIAHARKMASDAAHIDVLAASSHATHATHAARAHAAHIAAASGQWFDSAFSAGTQALRTQFAPLHAALGAAHQADHNSPEAIRARYATYAATATQWGMPSTAAVLTTIGNHKANQAGYKQAMAALQKLKDQLAAEEQLIAARVQVGSITKQQGAQQDIAAQKGIAPAMERAAEAALKYAQALKDPALIASLDAMLAKIHAMGTQLNDLQKGIAQSFQSGMQGFLQQFMLGRETWRTMFAQLNNAILSGINKNVAQSLSQSITGKGQNSGLGSWFLSLFGSGGGSSGGTSSGGTSSGGASWLSQIGSWFATTFGGSNSFFPSFAVGIDKVPHDMVAQIHAGERILPAATNSALSEALAAGSFGGGHTVHLNITALDSQSVLGAMDQIKLQLAQMIGGTASAYNLGAA